MKQARKNSQARTQEFRLAIVRIEHGRAHTKEAKLSVSSVAREVGVTPALIHNHYPSIVEEIRVKLGVYGGKSGDTTREALKAEREKSADLRKDLRALKERLARLATLNEVLLIENKTLKASVHHKSQVLRLPNSQKISGL